MSVGIGAWYEVFDLRGITDGVLGVSSLSLGCRVSRFESAFSLADPTIVVEQLDAVVTKCNSIFLRWVPVSLPLYLLSPPPPPHSPTLHISPDWDTANAALGSVAFRFGIG